MVIVLDEACQKWVLYVERHLFHEFVEAQCLDLSAQEEPLLQRQIVQGLTGDRTFSHVRFHRDEWIGAGVQFHHDCFWAGFCTRGLVAQTRQHIQERRERSFAVLAGPYLDSISSQVADFAGSPDAPPPPGAEEWARGMSNTLWLLYREEGLCSEMLDEADMEGLCSSSSDEDITGDEAGMVQRDKPKRKWLADDGPSRRRRQPPPRPRDGGGAGDGGRGAPKPKTMPLARSRCSSERVNLMEVARTRESNRAAKAKAMPAMVPGRPDVRDERASGSRGPMEVRSGMTLASAVDTWLLVLGIKDIDEEEDGFLPDRVAGSIRETFMGYNGQDRLTMALAFTRVVQGLLSSVGHILETAARSGDVPPATAATTADAAPATGRGADDREQVEVEVEADDDEESYYMQVAMTPVWLGTLEKLQQQLEEQPKWTRALNIRYLLSWLDHRHTNTRDGYWLGHSTGRAAELLALLAAFMEEGVELPQGSELQEGWARDWGLRLAGFLPVQPGSRMAMGRGPLAEPPIMCFHRPIPDELLYSDSEDNAPTLPMPGTRCVEVPPTLDDLLETEEEEQRLRRLEEECREEEILREEARVARDTAYLSSLQEGTEGKRKRKVMVVEISSGSADRPRVARCVRVPLEDDDIATMQVRMWRDDEEDQDEVETIPFHASSLKPVGVSEVEVPGQHQQEEVEGQCDGAGEGLAALQFETYIQVYERWAQGLMSSGDVLRLHGRDALDLMECQWAVQADTLMEPSRVAELDRGEGLGHDFEDRDRDRAM